MKRELACIVEGHGEVEALPILLRRLAERLDPGLTIDTKEKILRVPRDRLLKKTNELERALELLSRRLSGQGAILVLLDADDDLPCVLGPALLERARRYRDDVPVGVVIAHREYEAWFLAGAASLAGKRGLPPDLLPPTEPESIRGAKEWLGERLGRTYVETRDQAAFTALLDIEQARSARSLDKLVREVERLLHLAGLPRVPPTS